MKKFAKLIFLFLSFAIIVTGCGTNHTPSSRYRAVTQVDIVTRYEHTLIRRHYTDPQKMEAVLIYLRLIKPIGKPPQDPLQLDEDVFLIAVHLSDGNIRYYRQAAHQYFSREDQSWMAIDPSLAARLYAVMRHFPSDPYA